MIPAVFSPISPHSGLAASQVPLFDVSPSHSPAGVLETCANMTAPKFQWLDLVHLLGPDMTVVPSQRTREASGAGDGSKYLDMLLQITASHRWVNSEPQPS